jgi:glycosyltransferase involved in cell wall biosynthesis
MKVWFPTIQTHSGSDVFVRRLSSALRGQGIETEITWYPHWRELLPLKSKKVTPPLDTDVIHVNSWHGFPFAEIGVPMLTTCHHSVHDTCYKPYASFLQKIYHRYVVHEFERRTFLKSAGINAVSEYTSHILQKEFPEIKPIVIPNGIDIDFYSPPELPIQNIKTRILYVGNFSRRKGADLLAPIMEKLGGEFELRYNSGLSNKRVFIGSNCIDLGLLTDSELLREFQTCDIVLYPSRYEGFGYVACEAMACGKPVVTGSGGALKELITNGVTGFICEQDDVDSFVDSICKLAQSKDLRLKMGGAGRELVVNKYSSTMMASSYIKLYEQLIGSPSC